MATYDGDHETFKLANAKVHYDKVVDGAVKFSKDKT